MDTDYTLTVTDMGGEPVTTMRISGHQFLEALGIFGRLNGFPLRIEVARGGNDLTEHFRTMFQHGREMFAPVDKEPR